MSDATPPEPSALLADAASDTTGPLPVLGGQLEEVVALARSKDPGLPAETAQLLGADALRLLGDGVADAPDLARQLMAGRRDVGATAANVVATAACEVSARYPG